MGINSSRINIQNGGGLISGSTLIPELTASVFGTASWSQTSSVSITASYSTTASYSATASYVIGGAIVDTASYAIFAETASIAAYATDAFTSAYANTASYVKLLEGDNITIDYTANGIAISASVPTPVTQSSCYTTYTKYAVENPQFPVAGTYAGTTYSVSGSTDLTTALTNAVAGDIISLTADITVAATVTINKSVKVVGNGFAIQTAATSSDPTTVINVTADNVYLDSTLTVKQRKTTNTSIESAIAVDALGFVSEARVEFMETGYVLRGTDVSFNIGGETVYSGSLGNNHRHIIVYTMTQDSTIDGVEFKFPQETTPRASSIVLTYSTAGDVKTATLKVANTTQEATYGRQFFLIDSLAGITPGSDFGLIFDNNTWNDLNGGVGILSTSVSPLNYLKFLQLTNNFQGNAASGSYKGLVFLDGSGTVVPVGNTNIYYESNIHPTTLRADYSSAIDNGGIAYDNTALTNPLPIVVQSICETTDNALLYASSVAVTASNALTASYLNPLTQDVVLSGSLFVSGNIVARNLLVVNVTSSTEFSSGSTIFGDQLSDTHQFTGSVSITGSLYATASQAISSSYAATASYFITSSVTSASFAQTASYVVLAQTASYVTLAQTASYVLNAVSSSYAATASYIESGVIIESASYAVSSSFSDFAINALAANNAVSANTANLAATASYVKLLSGSGITINYQPNGIAISASVSSSFADTASFAQTASYVLQAVSSSYATTASFAEISISSSLAQTASFVATASWALRSVSASYVDITGSGIIVKYNGSQIQLTGSAEGGTSVTISDTAPTGSAADTGSLWFNSNDLGLYIRYQDTDGGQWVAVNPVGPIESSSYALSSSYTVTASYGLSASYAVSSSYTVTASQAISSSYADSASYSLSGSYAVSSSYAFTASSAISSSYSLSSSYAVSASYAFTASSAISSSYGLSASYAVSTSYAFTASSAISSSYASSGLSSSYAVSSSYSLSGLSASYAVSTSYALTASFAANATIPNLQAVTTAGNLSTSSILITGSLFGTSSQAISSSYASSSTSASYALSSSYAVTASYVLGGSTVLTSSYADTAKQLVNTSIFTNGKGAFNWNTYYNGNPTGSSGGIVGGNAQFQTSNVYDGLLLTTTVNNQTGWVYWSQSRIDVDAGPVWLTTTTKQNGTADGIILYLNATAPRTGSGGYTALLQPGGGMMVYLDLFNGGGTDAVKVYNNSSTTLKTMNLSILGSDKLTTLDMLLFKSGSNYYMNVWESTTAGSDPGLAYYPSLMPINGGNPNTDNALINLGTTFPTGGFFGVTGVTGGLNASQWLNKFVVRSGYLLPANYHSGLNSLGGFQ